MARPRSHAVVPNHGFDVRCRDGNRTSFRVRISPPQRYRIVQRTFSSTNSASWTPLHGDSDSHTLDLCTTNAGPAYAIPSASLPSWVTSSRCNGQTVHTSRARGFRCCHTPDSGRHHTSSLSARYSLPRRQRRLDSAGVSPRGQQGDTAAPEHRVWEDMTSTSSRFFGIPRHENRYRHIHPPIKKFEVSSFPKFFEPLLEQIFVRRTDLCNLDKNRTSDKGDRFPTNEERWNKPRSICFHHSFVEMIFPARRQRKKSPEYSISISIADNEGLTAIKTIQLKVVKE